MNLLFYGSINQMYDKILERFLRNLLETAIKPTLNNFLLDLIRHELRIRKYERPLKKLEEVVFHVLEVRL